MNAIYMLVTLLLGFIVFVLLIPHANRAWLYDEIKRFARLSQVGGYVHDTAMSQWISPILAYGDTATWAMAAGEVSGSLVYACDATDEVANLAIPLPLPSNSVAGKGSYLKSVEIDYEIKTAACDSVTATIVKSTRGAEGADVTVDAAVAFSQSPTAANSKTADEHKLVLTLTTPVWVDNDEYYYVKIAFDKAATSTVQFLGAVANYTARL